MRQYGQIKTTMATHRAMLKLSSGRSTEAAIGSCYGWGTRYLRRARNKSAETWYVMQTSINKRLAASYHCGGVE